MPDLNENTPLNFLTSATVTASQMSNTTAHALSAGNVYLTSDGYIVQDHYVGDTLKRTILKGAPQIPYIVGTQTAATKSWTGVAPFATLTAGQAILYKLPYTGVSGQASTLNLTLTTGATTEPTTGAITVKGIAGNTDVTNHYAAGSVILMTYDGTYWRCTPCYDTNSVGYQLRTNSTAMTVTDTARYYKIYFTSADNTQWVPASVDSTNNATSARAVNQRAINPFGRIVYQSANTDFTANAVLTATSIWDQYNLTLGYSFNRTGAALTLTNRAPIYLKCAPQTNGSVIIDANTPYVQSLPSTEDGKVYIFLGVATSATAMELVPYHPIYYYYNGAICLWTNAQVLSISKQIGQGYGTCDTDAATAAKTSSITDYNLVTGGIVAIYFSNNVPANATLNINSQGAKSIYHRNAAIAAGVIQAGDTATFMYDGTCYRVLAIDKPVYSGAYS